MEWEKQEKMPYGSYSQFFLSSFAIPVGQFQLL